MERIAFRSEKYGDVVISKHQLNKVNKDNLIEIIIDIADKLRIKEEQLMKTHELLKRAHELLNTKHELLNKKSKWKIFTSIIGIIISISSFAVTMYALFNQNYSMATFWLILSYVNVYKLKNQL